LAVVLNLLGEAVVLDRDGVLDFDAPASRKYDNRAQLYGFDMLVRHGEDLRPLPPHKMPNAEDAVREVDEHFAPRQDNGAIG
jgi:hypothetical protein